MKNLIYMMFALLLVVFVIAGCKKAQNPIAVNEKSVVRKATDTVPTTPPIPKDTTKLVPLTGDKITLLAGFHKSKLGDTSYVYFVAQTTNLYCASGKVNFISNLDANNNFSIDLIDARVPKTCIGPVGTISSGIIAFWQNNQNPYLANGSYPLKVTLNGTAYTGSINVSPTTITFNWNYTSGVLITPTTITR